MAVPSSGALSLLGIKREVTDGNYNGSGSHTNISLRATSLSAGKSAPDGFNEFQGYTSINTSFTVKSGYGHDSVTTSGGRRGNVTRYRFNEGYNGFTDSTNSISPPSGAVTNGTNVGISSGILGTGTVLIMAHKSGGINGLHRITFKISASSDSNSGFTQLAFANSTLSTSNTLQRSAANYTYASGYRQWQWAISAGPTGWYYLTNGSSGYSSKIFGDASSGTGTDSGFSVTVTLT